MQCPTTIVGGVITAVFAVDKGVIKGGIGYRRGFGTVPKGVLQSNDGY